MDSFFDGFQRFSKVKILELTKVLPFFVLHNFQFIFSYKAFILGNGCRAIKSPCLVKTKNSIHKRKWRVKLPPFASPFKKPIAALHNKPRIFKTNKLTVHISRTVKIQSNQLKTPSRVFDMPKKRI